VNTRSKKKSGESSKVKERERENEEEVGFGLSGSAKSLCIPLEQDDIHNSKCFACGKEAQKWTLFGRSY